MGKQYVQILDLISDDVNDKFMVTIYGKSKDNKNIVLNVIEFKPFFYVRVPNSWNIQTAKGFFEKFKFKDKKFTFDKDETEYDIKLEYLPKSYHNFYIYNEEKFSFLKLNFSSHNLMKKMINKIRKFYNACKEAQDPDKKSFYQLNDEGGEFRFDSNLYESNIHPLLRFIHDRDIQPSGWIEFEYQEEVKEKNKIYNCDIQYDEIPYENIKSYDSSDTSKYKIASFDIECDSSHGDFPAPRKDFKKLAVHIVDKYLSGKDRPGGPILYNFICDTIKYLMKDKISEDDDENCIYLKNGPYDENSIVEVFLDESENGDIDVNNKFYDMKKSFSELETLMKNNKRNEAIEILNGKKKKIGLLHKLKNNKGKKLIVSGDPVIQIGTVFYTYGIENSYERYILVIGPSDNMEDPDICSDLGENINVIHCKSEKKLLLRWVKLIQDHNPDYITGYNIFGFDFDYIIGRVEQLFPCKDECKYNGFTKGIDHCDNCSSNKFYNLGRLFKNDGITYDNNPSKRCKKIIKQLGGQTEEENSFMNNTLKYIHMDGRIIFDVQNEVKSGYSLDSYKLDNVAAHFIRGKVKGVRTIADRNWSYVDTDRLGNLKKGDYISFSVKNNYGDMKYDNGHKFMILNITDKTKYNDEKPLYTLQLDSKIRSSKLISSEKNDILYSEWCLNKDDVSPQELFDKHKWGTGEDRGLIAKYCIMDCELCIHLLLMLDFIPNNIGMSNVCKVPQPYIFLRGQGIKVQSIVTKFADKEGYKVPTLMGYDEEKSDNSGFEGAIVLDPKPGVYLDDPIAVVDYASLYPSSIIEKNISHDTYLGDYKDLKDKLEEKDKNGNLIYEEGRDYNRIQYDNYEYVQKEGTSVVEKKNVLNEDGTKEVMDCVFLSEHNIHVEKKKGIIPMVVGELLSARSATKKLLKKEKDENKKKVLDGFQLAYKLTANSVYGQLGAKTSCLSFKKVAACTTAVGRQKIIDAKKYAFDWALSPTNTMIYNPLRENKSDEEYEQYYNNIIKSDEDNLLTDKKSDIYNGIIQNTRELECKKYSLLDVVYGDTDSIFIKFSRKKTKDEEPVTKLEAVDHCIQCGLKAGEYITEKLKEDNWPEDKPGYPQDLEYEKTFYPFILISKKRYTGEKYEFSSKEVPKRTSMGLVTKRRDNAPIVKYVFGNMVNRLMSNASVNDVIKWLKNTLDYIVSGREDISMFVISKTLNSYYKNPQSIAHRVLADRMGARDPGNKPKANDRIPYAYIEVDDKPVKTGKYFQKDEIIHNGYYKNGKEKTKKIRVNDLNRPKFIKKVVLQGDRIEHVDYIAKNRIPLDYKFYISNQIMKPVKQLLDIAIDPEETTKLFNSYLQ